MEQRVSLITLGVDDLEKAARFYQALGWTREVVEEQGIVVFNLLSQVLGLYPCRLGTTCAKKQRSMRFTKRLLRLAERA